MGVSQYLVGLNGLIVQFEMIASTLTVRATFKFKGRGRSYLATPR